jgi:hypothetical protein
LKTEVGQFYALSVGQFYALISRHGTAVAPDGNGAVAVKPSGPLPRGRLGTVAVAGPIEALIVHNDLGLTWPQDFS